MNEFDSNYEKILIEDFDYLTEILESSHDIFVKLTTNDASNAELKLSTFEHYTQIVEVSELLLEVSKERRIRLNNILHYRKQLQSEEESTNQE
jgi:ubiquinone biosynthesis protein Coq4